MVNSLINLNFFPSEPINRCSFSINRLPYDFVLGLIGAAGRRLLRTVGVVSRDFVLGLIGRVPGRRLLRTVGLVVAGTPAPGVGLPPTVGSRATG